MSKVDFHRNTFLEIEELNRFQKFMLESNVNKTFLSNTINWGIIDTSGGTSPNDFKVEEGTNLGTVKIATLSRSLTKSGLLIEQQPIDNIAITDDSLWYWLKIAHVYTPIEEGTCSVDANGVVSGNGTKFTEVLRGVSSKVPVKIRFASSPNQGNYDVVNVIDDLNIIIQGDAFVPTSGLRYAVIGSTPLGETVTSEQQYGLYSYDSCLITRIAETVTDLPPAGLVADEEFWIARVKNTGGTVTVYDRREYLDGSTAISQYWEYYIRGVSDKLNKYPINWSFSESEKATAQSALGVYSITRVNELVGTDILSWTAMSPGAASQLTNPTFNIKINRVGRLCTITGQFKTVQNTVQGSIIATFPRTTLGSSYTLTSNIYHQAATIQSGIDAARGVRFYVSAFSEGTGDLQIVVDEAIDDTIVYFTLAFNLV